MAEVARRRYETTSTSSGRQQEAATPAVGRILPTLGRRRRRCRRRRLWLKGRFRRRRAKTVVYADDVNVT